jgi:hypothetical protein
MLALLLSNTFLNNSVEVFKANEEEIKLGFNFNLFTSLNLTVWKFYFYQKCVENTITSELFSVVFYCKIMEQFNNTLRDRKLIIVCYFFKSLLYL